MKVFEILDCGKKELLGNSFDKSLRVGLESETFLGFVLGKRREWLHAHDRDEVSQSAFEEFMKFIRRRKEGEPMEYLIKKAGFYGETFYVDERVLIPRSETEILVDKALEIIRNQNIPTMGEIGAGSGNVSIMIALRCPQISIVATDVSSEALEVAALNLNRFHTPQNRLKERVRFVCADLFEGVGETPGLMVSNPPYVADDYPLAKNVLHEPKRALFGGKRGDETLKRIIDFCADANVGLLACEIGFDQRKRLEERLSARGYAGLFYEDYAGFDRGFVATRKGV